MRHWFENGGNRIITPRYLPLAPRDITVTCSKDATLRGNNSPVIVWIILLAGETHVGEGKQKDAFCQKKW
jgi:hypothetical protein